MLNKTTAQERIKRVRVASERNSPEKIPHEILVAKIKISTKLKILKRRILETLRDEDLELHFVVNRDVETIKYERRISSGMTSGAEKIFGRDIYGLDVTIIYGEDEDEIISEDVEYEDEDLPTAQLSKHDIMRLKYRKYAAKVIKGAFLGIRGNIQIRKITSFKSSTYLFSEKMRYEDFVHLLVDLKPYIDSECIDELARQFKKDFLLEAYKRVKYVVIASKPR
ncbi:hypothetical protein H7X65_02260 [Candidatus Parcubacteria bacterium]|nr:hypothetical protein [Candidatus Parcubacteria bacterium]